MPAFGTHETEEVVAITAFVQQLPGLSSEDYATMTQGRPDPGAAPSTE